MSVANQRQATDGYDARERLTIKLDGRPSAVS